MTMFTMIKSEDDMNQAKLPSMQIIKSKQTFNCLKPTLWMFVSMASSEEGSRTASFDLFGSSGSGYSASNGWMLFCTRKT